MLESNKGKSMLEFQVSEIFIGLYKKLWVTVHVDFNLTFFLGTDDSFPASPLER